ncbi:hypothetical protein TNCV_4000771 [Trichonephila clavipes]|nr:hypothetical protein TNCV_4000771 [Trichonephila clavipes]
MIPLEQFGPVKQSSDLASHLCILSVHFVEKFLTATIAASIFAQLCPHVTGDVLLLSMTTQIQALRQHYHFRSRSVTYKVFENFLMASFIIFL